MIKESYNYKLFAANVLFFNDDVTKSKTDIVTGQTLGNNYDSCCLSFLMEHNNKYYQLTVADGCFKLYDITDTKISEINNDTFTFLHKNKLHETLRLELDELGSCTASIISQKLEDKVLFHIDSSLKLMFSGDVFESLFVRQHIGIDKNGNYIERICPELKDKYNYNDPSDIGIVLSDNDGPIYNAPEVYTDNIDDAGYHNKENNDMQDWVDQTMEDINDALEEMYSDRYGDDMSGY